MADKFGRGSGARGRSRSSATVEASHAAQGVNELRQELKTLRLAVLEMLDAQVNGEEVDLSAAPFRQLLHLSEDASVEEAMLRLREMQASVVGQLECACGAMVDLREGVDEVTCPWCGAKVGGQSSAGLAVEEEPAP